MDHVPPEIFRDIIKRSLDVYDLRTSLPYAHMREIPQPPFNASQVCRSWRSTLLDDPTMWTCIVLTHTIASDAINEMLRRSKSSPLHVLIDLIKRHRPVWDHKVEALDNVFQEMHRIRTLQLKMDEYSLGRTRLESLLAYLKRPAPILEEFDFVSLRDPSRHEGEHFISTLFSENAPNLKHISLKSQVRLERVFCSPLFKNLSSLHLNLTCCGRINLEMFLDLLESSPGLHALSIALEIALNQNGRYEDVIIDPSASYHRQVRLPCLRRLFLSRETRMTVIVNHLLRHIDCPFDSLDFEITVHEGEMNSSSSCVEFINQHRLPFLQVDTFKKYIIFSDTYPPNQAKKLFEIKVESYRFDFLQVFRLSDITRLDFRSFPRGDGILEFLELLPRLEVLWLGSIDLEGLLIALRALTGGTSAVDEDHGLDPDILLCPPLKELVLEIEHEKLNLQHAEILVQCLKDRRRDGFSFKVVLRHIGRSWPLEADVESCFKGEPSIEAIKIND